MKCEFKYTTDFIFLRSNWFDKGDNKIKKIGRKGLFLYLSLFRFLVNNQQHTYTFYTSIDKLRKCTGYSATEVFTLIRLLHKEKIIDTNSKWSRWFVDDKLNGELKDHDFIVIQATAYPNVIYDKTTNKNKPATDSPDDKYVTVDLRLMQLYQDKGFDERYYAVFCLINKMSNKTEGKMWMKINTMADTLGFGDTTVSHIIRELNRNYLLVSALKNNGKGDKMYEHKILNNIDWKNKFQSGWQKEQIEKNIKKWDKPKKKKAVTKKIDDEFLLVEDDDNADILPEEISELFDNVEDDPFYSPFSSYS